MVYACAMSLKSKVALVTGGGRGIGAAVARKLAAEGARVAVTGRTEPEISQVAGELGGLALQSDFTDRASVNAMVERLLTEVGRVDVLVNNAGIALSAPLHRVSDDAWDRMMEVNATAAFRLCRALVPGMVEAGWGRVINVASNAGVTGYPYSAAYCASKHAMVGMTRALAVDLAKTGVTVNAVCPGWVETRMARKAIERIAEKTGRSEELARESLAKMSPQGRIIEPEEVAHAVFMLCSESARGIHGQTILIDGGQVLK